MNADLNPPNQAILGDATVILESMGDAFYALDGDWRMVYANRHAIDFWRLAPAAVIGRVIWDALPQLIGTRNEAILRQVRREQRAITFEAPSPVTGAWVSVSVCPAGEGICVYWRDISQRIDAESALRRNEAHLRLAQEAGGIGAWEWDLERDTMVWSHQMYRVMGLADTSEPASESLLLACLHPDERANANSLLAELRARPGSLRMELCVLASDGSLRWIVFLGQVIADRFDRPVRMLGVAIDGTARHHGEDAIREDAERLRLAIGAGGLATWEFNVHNQIRSWSSEAAIMHGFPADKLEMTREEWRNIIHPDDLPMVRIAFAKVLRGTSDYAVEYRIVRSDGDIRWTAVHGTLLRGPDGEPQRVIGVLQDVTKRKEAEQMLRESEQRLRERVREEVAAREEAQTRAAQAERLQALGQLAGGIAHDFNNVLQSIQGGAALITRRANDPAAVQRLTSMLLDASARGASITRRLLAFARCDHLRAEPLDAVALLEGMREVLAAALGPTIQLKVEAPADLPAVLADRGQLETAVVNLATNARDAMPAGGSLVISAAINHVPPDPAEVYPAMLRPGWYIRMAVSDTGTGIDPAILGRVMDPFFTTKPAGLGTGLGLPMVKGFAEQSGGGLAIRSEPGRGTTVLLWLPQADASAQADVAIADADSARTGARVLLVDDEAMVRELLAAQLEELGCHVVVAEHGEEALSLLASGEPIDALVTDLSMPNMDGLALIRLAQVQQPQLPAILLTGYAGDGATQALSGATSGSFSLLRKPISADQLADRIAALLEGKASRQSADAGAVVSSAVSRSSQQ